MKLNREDHLAIPMKLLQHLGITVFQTIEQYFDLFENIFLWLWRVDPLSKLVEQLLFEDLSVFFSSEVRMNLADTSWVRIAQAFFHGASIEIEEEHVSKVSQLPWQSNDKGVLEINFLKEMKKMLEQWEVNTYLEFGTVLNFNRNLSQWIIVKP